LYFIWDDYNTREGDNMNGY